MPELRSDDGPRRLRALWLGPKGATLPFEWTYVQWLVVLLMVGALGSLFGGVALWWLGDVVYAVAAAVLWGAPAGAYLGVRVMRGVTVDEPVRAKVATVRAQLGLHDHGAPPRDAVWTFQFPRVREDVPGLADIGTGEVSDGEAVRA